MIDISHAQTNSESQEKAIQSIENESSEQILIVETLRGRPSKCGTIRA